MNVKIAHGGFYVKIAQRIFLPLAIFMNNTVLKRINPEIMKGFMKGEKLWRDFEGKKYEK